MDLDTANKMIVASFRRAQEQGIRISSAVVDEGGHLVAFARMDGASWVTVKISQGKAYAAAAFRTPTAALAERRKTETFWTDIVGVHEGKMVLAGGGLPVKVGGHFAGAVGVSGGKEEQDIECATAGVKAAG
ncbi:MAG: heme-binding protein [Chloroflexi bacterium]|nr:heme-binding protein [Chloroflexota bacterium]